MFPQAQTERVGIQRVRGKEQDVEQDMPQQWRKGPGFEKSLRRPLLNWTPFHTHLLSEVMCLFQTENNECRVKNKGKQKHIAVSECAKKIIKMRKKFMSVHT